MTQDADSVRTTRVQSAGDEDIPLLEDRVGDMLPPTQLSTTGNAPLQSHKGANPFLPYDRLAELARERATFNAELSRLLEQPPAPQAQPLNPRQIDQLADQLLQKLRPRIEQMVRQLIDEQLHPTITSRER